MTKEIDAKLFKMQEKLAALRAENKRLKKLLETADTSEQVVSDRGAPLEIPPATLVNLTRGPLK